GDDALALAMMAAGASGVISVTSNVLPGRVCEVTRLLCRGELAAARAAHFALLPLHGLMFVEPNPVPCKQALDLLGRARPDVRLPLVKAGESTRARLAGLLSEMGLAVQP
ncbi:MAG: dihydrodipicolinate synthase family protein, partial [Deltaproteobacteria bacterium]|nr:dihydrodipicolinate synthase family protein [Deltaproteobacteria bacterium]